MVWLKNRISTYFIGRENKIFLLKAITMISILLISGFLFFSKYTIGYDSKDIRCIMQYSVYLIEKHERTLVRGQIYVFNSKDLRPFYNQGQKLTKYLHGMPGDVVEIDASDNVIINGVVVARGLDLAEQKLQIDRQKLRGKRTLGSDEYWMLGDSKWSFDSRYWGSIHAKDIVSVAHPLF